MGRKKYMASRTSLFTRTLGIAAGDAVNICVATGSTQVPFGIQISIVESSARERIYRVDVKSNETQEWKRLVPVDRTESGTTWGLDALVQNNVATFRLVRIQAVAGEPTSLRCKVAAASAAGGSVTVAGSETISSGVTNTGTYGGVLLTQVDGKVGIGTENPSATLDVQGSAIVSGNVQAGNVSATAIAASGNVQAGNVSANAIAGTTLTGSTLTLSGNLTAGNLSTNAIAGTTLTGSTLTLSGNLVSGNLSSNAVSANTMTSSGNVRVNGSTFFVDTVANRVGINTTNMFHALDVIGDVSCSRLRTGGGILAMDGTTIYSAITASSLTSVGILTSLQVGGNARIGNVSTNAISATAIAGSSLTLSGNLVSGNLSTNVLTAATITASTVAGTLTTASQPNITSVGTLSSASVSGTLSVGGNASIGNVSTNAISATTIAGTLTTASQPNITSIGTLSSASISGALGVGQTQFRTFTRILGLTTGDSTRICSFVHSDENGYIVHLAATQGGSYNSISKCYTFAMNHNSTSGQWKRLCPLSTSPINTQWGDYAVDVWSLAGFAQVRLVRTQVGVEQQGLDIICSLTVNGIVGIVDENTTGTGATNTGIYMNALLTQTNDRVGIGTDAPSSTLHVVGDGNVTGNLRVDTNTLFVDAASNRVGINTNTPSSALHVVGNATATAISASGVITASAGNTAASGIRFPDNTGGGSGDSAYIRYYARSGEDCTLEIGAINDTSDHIALMPSGSVGIGTTTPAHRLDVAGGNVNVGLAFGYAINGQPVLTGTGLSTRTALASGEFTWTLRTNPSNQFTSIAQGNGIYVAVASSGTGNRVATSPDGVTWTSRTSPADLTWTSVAYGLGTFVAVASSGTGNRAMWSTDGTAWTSANTAADNNWTSVTFGEGLFVAVASSGTGNRVMTSSNGVTWTARTSAADHNWTSLAYGNELFVAVASSGTGNRVMTSGDGITWTLRQSAADNNWSALAYGGNLFVAVSNSGPGNRVMTSPDGLAWTLRRSALDINWAAVAWAGGVFAAVSTSGTGNRVMTSTDGIVWTLRTSPADNQWDGIVGTDTGYFVACALDGTNRFMTWQAPLPTVQITGEAVVERLTASTIGFGNDNACLLTPSPMNPWVARTVPNSDWRDVTYSNGIFVAISWNGAVMTSVNGVQWSQQATQLASSGYWSSLAYGNGTYVAVSGISNVAAISTNGINWTAVSLSITGVHWDGGKRIAYGNGLFVVIGYVSQSGNPASVSTSLDGITWITRTCPDNIWSGVCFGNGMFVAVAREGSLSPVMTSVDGITWTGRAAPAFCWDVTYGNGLFVAVGNGVVMTSSDGINWTLRTVAASNNWRRVVFASGVFTAISVSGTGNRVMVSRNGIAWSSMATTADAEWRTLEYGNGCFVALSNGTSAMTWDYPGRMLTLGTSPSANLSATLAVTGDAQISNRVSTDALNANAITASSIAVTSGTLSVTGNASVGNLSANAVAASTLSVTGNALVNGNTLFVNAASNRVGINTNTPSSALHVVGNASVGNLATTALAASTLALTGNAAVGNLAATALAASTLDLTGNLVSGNLSTNAMSASAISVTGNSRTGNMVTVGTAEVWNAQNNDEKWRLIVSSDATGNFFQIESFVSSQWQGYLRIDK